MKLAVVVQRYGPDVVGGAERLCRGVAEGLAARRHEVEVLTSCARSYVTWANVYPEGAERHQGVLVRRFRSERERDIEAFNRLSEELFSGARSADDERAWVDAQGPYVPRLLDYLHGVAGDHDHLLFFTYLYYPTVHGIQAAPERSFLVPTAHDEAPLYLRIYEPVFALPAGLVFNTEAEGALVRRRFSRLPRQTRVIGAGIDHLDVLAADIDELAANIDELATNLESGHRVGARESGGADPPAAPVVLYAGRIEAGKGVAELIEYLRRWRADNRRDLRLWLIGEVAMELPVEDWIEVLGFVSEEEKLRRLRAATVVACPSALESFGIVALEAMASGTPVLANAASEAAVEHCRRGNGGLWYRDGRDFRETLGMLLDDARLRRTMAARGATYVQANYAWPTIIDRYEQLLGSL